MRPFFNNQQQLYNQSCPPWHDPEGIAGVAELEAAAEVIIEELTSNLADPARAKLCYQKLTLAKQAGWRQIELMIYGVNYPKRAQLFPQTMKVLKQVPGLATAYFSALAPHKSIAAHVGDTDAYYRVHLGLVVPSSLPDCGLEVAGMAKSWESGKCLAFTDIYYHRAWNDTDQERIVLIVDILRPEFRDQQLWVDAGVRATLYWSRIYHLIFPLVEMMPRVVTRLIRPGFHLVSYAWHRFVSCFRRL